MGSVSLKKSSTFVLFSSISIVKQFTITLLFNSVIAFLLYRLLFEDSFLNNLIVSQLIGLSIFGSLHGVYQFRHHYFQQSNISFAVTLLSLIIGSVAGVSLVAIFSVIVNGITITDFFIARYDLVFQYLFFAFLFGAVIIHYFMSRETLSRATIELQEHKLSILANEKTIVEGELKLLQSQIEPHFLINTLSNVIGLIENEPRRSKILLESLSHYLRATLEYTRRDSAVIKDELNMITAYLDIFKERMGDRLKFNIEVDQQLYHLPFAPMLLQPIVENAIRHGIDPLINGGEIFIKGRYDNQKIIFLIEDNGGGLEQESGDGVGLTNVQQRLKALYGNEASLDLQNTQPTGLRVTIAIPHEPGVKA
ncbi:MAG: sensor histidine kinase [Thiohalomonadales bacterium]